jgi:hypothetical protein
MRRIVMTRAGGYDPKLGPKHPKNRDPTLEEDESGLVESDFKGDHLTRTVQITGVNNMGQVRITEDDNDHAVVSCIGGDVTLDATKLWNLAVGIVELFGGKVLCSDQVHERESNLREKIFDVLVDHEARCLDDNIDRDVVLAALIKALR